MNYSIKKVSPKTEQVKELFDLLDKHNLSHCSREVCHLTQPEEMDNLNSVLLGVVINSNIVSIGGVKFFADYAEVTRMYTREEFRGKGYSKAILREMENLAIEKGFSHLKLETSEKFKSAIILYNKVGFKKCEAFGEYINQPINTYLEKELKR